jgi:hypothetical protein
MGSLHRKYHGLARSGQPSNALRPGDRHKRRPALPLIEISYLGFEF